MKKFAAILLVLFVAVPVAAVTVTPVYKYNSYVNTTAEQITSDSTVSACKSVTVCNYSTTAGENTFVANDSSPSSTNGVKLFPRAATDGGQDCVTWNTGQPKGKNEPDTLNGTSFYAKAQTGIVQLMLICIP